jgi:hypothetical protein
MAQRGNPAVFVISIAFETLDVKGVVSPFYAKLTGRPAFERISVAEKSANFRRAATDGGTGLARSCLPPELHATYSMRHSNPSG